MPTPTFQNVGFESAGAAPGLAAGWTLALLSSAEEIAGFGPTPERAHEDFERAWLANETFHFSLSPLSTEPALYDDDPPESVEDFEEGWSQNEDALSELASIDAADYDPGPGTELAETFDGQWANNEAFLTSFAPTNLSAASPEPFETGWQSNGTFVFAFAPGQLSAASYDAAGAAEPVEDFEELWPTLVMTSV